MSRVEISVDSLESAVAAERGGAQRIELCSALREGGLTPSLGLIRTVRSRVSLDLYVLIRPRSGDFLHSEEEMDIMREDIAVAAQEGVDGVVLGLLTAEGDVDVERTKALVSCATPLQVTFHRAFDMARHLEGALEDVIRCGVTRVLTSGGRPSAMQGREQLRALVDAAAGRITILAGGGIRPTNAAALVQATGVVELHSSMRKAQPSAMTYRAPEMHLGDAGMDEYARTTVAAEEVRQLVESVQSVAAV